MPVESSKAMVHTRINGIIFQKIRINYLHLVITCNYCKSEAYRNRLCHVLQCNFSQVKQFSLFTMALPQATKWEYCLHKWMCLWIYWVSCRPQPTSGVPPNWECNRWLTTAHHCRSDVVRNVIQYFKFIRIPWLRTRKNSERLLTIK